MSNRKKPRVRKLVAESALKKINLPVQEDLEIVKKVPAIIHWDQIDTIGRHDDETIGEAVIYDDGTSDIIVFQDISEDAKKMVYGGMSGIDHFSIADPEEN